MLVGWQGISVLVPEEWALAAVGGEERAGYLRVDDPRGPRLQVKWSPGPVDLARKREEYARRLAWRKGRLPGQRRPSGQEVDPEARVLSHRAKPGKELAGFAWRGRHCGMGVMWNCKVCGRAVIAQVLWRPEENLHETAREVLASLEDHGEGGWRWWGLDGLSFLAPETYLVERHRRLTRQVELRVGRSGRWVRVARWGMVALVLDGRGVDEWFADELRGRREVVVGPAGWKGEAVEIKGHEGVATWGEVRRPVWRAVADGLRGRKALSWAACAWHCPEANRLFLVESVDRPDGEVLEGVVKSIVCHPGAGE